MAKYKIIPIFVPHMGCPNDCVFCNQRKISGTSQFDIEDAKEEINKYLEIYSYTSDVELAFYGGSFTMIDKNVQKELLSVAKKLKDGNKISKIRMSTRPDAINEEVINRLKYYTVDTIELGVQSLDPFVLKKSKRNHTVEDLYSSYKLLRENNFTVGLQQMVGLPGDTEEKSLKTAIGIAELKPDFVRIYPTLVIKDTELEEMYKTDIYVPLKVDEAVSISSKLWLIYNYYNVPVIRLGLQSSEDLQPGSSVVSGPHHDAIGEIVKTSILTDILIDNVDELKNNSIIKGSPKDISQLVGQKAMGKAKLLKHYNINNIKMIYDKTLKYTLEVEGTTKIDLNREKKKLGKELINVFKKY